MALDTPTREIRFLDLAASHDEVRPELDEAWHGAVSSGGFIGGHEASAFESEYAAYCGAAECVGVANGTDALELILAAAGIGPGDDVIVPANTFIATAEAVVRVGARPVFADVDPETMLLTGDSIRHHTTAQTAAVMAVHLYGQMVDVDDIAGACADLGLALIEDAAQAHGARWNQSPAGSVGLAAGFSFYPGKNLGALGDGGAVVTSDAQLAERIRSLSNHGRSLHSKYEHDLIGRNSRLDALQAAALRVKLRRLDQWNERRRSVADWYRHHLPSTVEPLSVRPEAEAVHHLGVVRCLGLSREEATTKLDEAGIGWGIHYPVPCHRQRPFASGDVPSHGDSFPVTESLATEIISLPMHPHIVESDVIRVAEVLSG